MYYIDTHTYIYIRSEKAMSVKTCSTLLVRPCINKKYTYVYTGCLELLGKTLRRNRIKDVPLNDGISLDRTVVPSL